MTRESMGNMYDFISHTWNPIKGVCSHECSYCFMKKRGVRLSEPRIEIKEFSDLGYGNFIFVGSSIDMWAEDILSDWILFVLDYCNKYKNRYLFQSKNPQRILDFIDHPTIQKSVICTTIETNRYYPNIMNNSPAIEDRVKVMEAIATKGIDTYVTAEPLMQFDLEPMVAFIRRCNPKQVNIGRNTFRKVVLPEPTPIEAQALKAELTKFTKVKVKENARIWF